MLKVVLITLTLLLLLNGFLTEAMDVIAQEGHASWLREGVDQMIKQGKLLLTMILVL